MQVALDYQGFAIAFQDDGWFNATQAASKWGKRPVDWLSLQSTKDYIEALKRHGAFVGKSHKSKTGQSAFGGGTWMHPKLAVAFARWLDADFSVWCDAQIDSLIRALRSHPKKRRCWTAIAAPATSSGHK